MALPAGDRLSFQAAVAGPRRDIFCIPVLHTLQALEPRTLPTSENIFTDAGEIGVPDWNPGLAHSSRNVSGKYGMKHVLTLVKYYAGLGLCLASLLLCGLRVWASDEHGSTASDATQRASSSVPPNPQPTPVTQEKTGQSAKYDVGRIGQRKVGDGVNLYSLEKERVLGQSMATQINLRTIFVVDPEINDYINRLGQKIARNSDAQVPFTIKVIDSPGLNSFALPGGFLYVDKGLIMEVDSEAELAGLMAHEIAHVAARHATRLATRKYAWNLISVPLAFLGGPASMGTRQIGPLSMRKFSRDSEIEADLLGVEYQYAAGYDPQAFVEALEKLHSKETSMRTRAAKGGQVPLHDQIARAFANYPPTEERIEKVQAEISAMLPSRDDYISDTSEFEDVKAKLASADPPILRRRRPGDTSPKGPVLHRRPPQESQPYRLADISVDVTKGRQALVFSDLPALP